MIGNSLAGIYGTGAPPIPPSSFESIATETVGSGGTASITFSSIAADWTHLQVRALSRHTGSGVPNTTRVQLNGDTATNYSSHLLGGSGSAAFATAASTIPLFNAGAVAGSAASANVFGAFIMDILDYKNVSKYKTSRSLSGIDNNGSGEVGLVSGLWQNTAAVTSITIFAQSGDLAEYSTFALYGVK